MKDKAIFDEVNEKINRIKQKFTIRMDWDVKESQDSGEVVDVYTDTWQEANNVANGAKIKAIEEIIPLISNNTQDMLNDFYNRHLNPDPEMFVPKQPSDQLIFI